MRTKLIRWFQQNAVAVFLSIAFVAVYIAKEIKPEINDRPKPTEPKVVLERTIANPTLI